jgi:hypothetical protein
MSDWRYLLQQKKSVKPYLVITCLLVALSYFLMKVERFYDIPVNRYLSW